MPRFAVRAGRCELVVQVVEFPLDDGGVLLVQAAAADEPSGGLGLASSLEDKPKRAAESLESALAHVTPALKSVTERLKELAPDELTVEFGLTLTAETGVIVAKGNREVHFTVTLAWSGENGSTDGGGGA
jgi:hypothetical protein